MRAAATLGFRIERSVRGLRRLRAALAPVLTLSGAPGSRPLDRALVVRLGSGHPVLHGPVEPRLERFLRRAVEGDLARMSESGFLQAWGPPGGRQERFDRWRERGWVPPVR